MKIENKTKAQLLIELQELRRQSAAAATNNERYRFLVENTSDYVGHYSSDGTLLFASAAMCAITGFKPEEVIGTSGLERVHPEDRPQVQAVLKAAIETGRHQNVEYRAICRNGQCKWVEMSGKTVRNDQTGEMEIIAVVREIGERKRAEAALQESEKRYRLLAEKMTDMVWIMDLNFHTVYVSPSIKKVLGFSPEERMVQDVKDQLTPASLSAARDALARELLLDQQQQGNKERSVTIELEYYHKDGSTRWIESIINGIRNDQGVLIVLHGVSRDITERRKAEKALRMSEERYRDLSILDDLTQLYNPRHFYNQLKSEMERVNRYGQPLTLLLLDIDDFKAFNDTYGHIEGDRVLSRAGQVIKKCLRHTDTAYRYGGEEFTVLLPMTTSEDGVVTAERIRTAFKEDIFSPDRGKNIRVTVSIGLGQYQPQENIKDFVHRVDQLMYHAKNGGKDRIVMS